MLALPIRAPVQGPSSAHGPMRSAPSGLSTPTTSSMSSLRSPHIWGNLTVAGDTVTIQEAGGKTAKGCKGPGVYHFSRSAENTLAFTLVRDGCKERIKNVTLAW